MYSARLQAVGAGLWLLGLLSSASLDPELGLNIVDLGLILEVQVAGTTLEVRMTVKVTLDLEREAVEWFKREAKRQGGSYLRMIRNLATSYVRRASRS